MVLLSVVSLHMKTVKTQQGHGVLRNVVVIKMDTLLMSTLETVSIL